MTYGFIQDVPANEEMYQKVRALLPATAPGLIVHVAIQRDGGLRYIDVWETEADWVRFRDEHVEPSVDEVLASYGIPHDHSLVSTDVVGVVDVWCDRR
jgi:hypothetical protein